MIDLGNGRIAVYSTSGETCTVCKPERLPEHHAMMLDEVERLRALLNEYADHAEDSGWHNLAEEIRRRTDNLKRVAK